MEPTWNELGNVFKSRSDIVIAKIDGLKNDIEGIKIVAFPTFLLFPKSNRVRW